MTEAEALRRMLKEHSDWALRTLRAVDHPDDCECLLCPGLRRVANLAKPVLTSDKGQR